MNTIGTRLLKARKAARLTQAALAKLVGVTQPTISDLENSVSQTMDGATLVGLKNALNVRPEWLLHGEGAMREFADDIVDIVMLFRSLTPGNRAALLAAGRALLDSQGNRPDAPDHHAPPHRPH